MATRIEAYVDTGALIAFLDRSDTHHPLFARLFSEPPQLLTSSLVVAEGHGWFLRRYDPQRALQFLDFVGALPRLKVAPANRAALEAATELLRRFSDQPLTLADAMGLHLMAEHRIPVCWSTDRHLSLTGVPLVIHRQDRDQLVAEGEDRLRVGRHLEPLGGEEGGLVHLGEAHPTAEAHRHGDAAVLEDQEPLQPLPRAEEAVAVEQGEDLAAPVDHPEEVVRGPRQGGHGAGGEDRPQGGDRHRQPPAAVAQAAE
ncbi:MAG: PIN domain-containing protein, partial [Nitrospirae bacterium]